MGLRSQALVTRADMAPLRSDDFMPLQIPTQNE